MTVETPPPNTAVDPFGGPGGWEVYAPSLGLDVLGVELDPDACATRIAAGLPTVQADVARLDPDMLGAFEGLIASPPCQMFSPAGKGAGRAVALQDALHVGMRAAARGASRVELARRRDAVRRIFVAYLRETEGWKRRRSGRLEPPGARWTPNEATPIRRAEVSRRAREMARAVTLVWEPARWAAAMRPRWIALEQVPPVLPLWKNLARELEGGGLPSVGWPAVV